MNNNSACFVKVTDDTGSPYWINLATIEAMYEEPEFAGTEDAAFTDAHPARTMLDPIDKNVEPYYCLETPEAILAALK